VTITGVDLAGDEVTVVGDELLGRVFQHEVDHLDGVLMLERLDADNRKLALRTLREQVMNGGPVGRDRRHAL
jgi:peptide deformylase